MKPLKEILTCALLALLCLMVMVIIRAADRNGKETAAVLKKIGAKVDAIDVGKINAAVDKISTVADGVNVTTEKVNQKLADIDTKLVNSTLTKIDAGAGEARSVIRKVDKVADDELSYLDKINRRAGDTGNNLFVLTERLKNDVPKTLHEATETLGGLKRVLNDLSELMRADDSKRTMTNLSAAAAELPGMMKAGRETMEHTADVTGACTFLRRWTIGCKKQSESKGAR
jgi:ABC-type transporter Mla subunit MlaD